MITFPHPGKQNTDATLRMALDYAKEHGLDIVLASSTGETALTMADLVKTTGFDRRVIVVSHVYGMSVPDENDMPEETRQAIQAAGFPVVTASHALSGGERGLSKQFGGVNPVELVAHTLRMFGQGTKVCVEIALMAADCGLLSSGRPVVAVGGTAQGVDTACVLSPGYTASMLDTRIHEYLCKPHL